MTIGVVNELRGKGIATEMIKYIEQDCSLDKKIKYIYLHVVDYNHSARKFYEKNNFNYMVSKPQYYNIENARYGAILYLKYTNNGERPRTFFETLKLLNIFALIYNSFSNRSKKKSDNCSNDFSYKSI